MNSRSLLLLPLALAATAILVPAVQADDNFSARINLSKPTEDLVGDYGANLGLSYHLKPKSDSKLNLRVDLDYQRSGRTVTDAELTTATLSPSQAVSFSAKVSSNSYGLTLNALYPFADSKVYGGLGLGVYRVKVKGQVLMQEEGGPEMVFFEDTDTSTKFGGKATLGYSFSEKFFGELAYTKISEADGFDPSYWSAGVGVKF